MALIQKLQQHADGLRRQGNATGAKDTTETIKSVRANKMLVLPKLGEELGNIGTIKIEEVLEQADGGTWIQTSLPNGKTSALTPAQASRADPQLIKPL